MIIEEIKARNLQAIREKDMMARAIYGIVINKHMLLEVDKRSRQEHVTDVEMISVLQKTIKELTEEEENYKKVNNSKEAENACKQKALLQSFLPKMMEEEEIKQIILNQEDKSIPAIMKYFKANFSGKCDMALVQKVLKTF